MNHAQQGLWLATNTLLLILLVRAISIKLFARYPIFYLYLMHVLTLSLVRIYFYFARSAVYVSIYWYTQFLSVAIGYCVIWQIYKQILAGYPGTLRMAKMIVSGLFALVMLNSVLGAASASRWSLVSSIEQLERNLRSVQLCLLAILIGLVVFYSIPLGRNMRGMLQGYGFFVATSVIDLTLRSFFSGSPWPWWRYSQPALYLVTLCIWAMTLWSFEPNPAPTAPIELEMDYNLLTQRTTYAIAKARNHIIRAVRP